MLNSFEPAKDAAREPQPEPVREPEAEPEPAPIPGGATPARDAEGRGVSAWIACVIATASA